MTGIEQALTEAKQTLTPEAYRKLVRDVHDLVTYAVAGEDRLSRIAELHRLIVAEGPDAAIALVRGAA